MSEHIKLLNCLIKEQDNRKFKLIEVKEYIIDLQREVKQLKAKNNGLNEDIDGLKRNILEKENCSPRYYLVTTHREWNELYKKFNYQREQKNKYKQCLDEIEEICKTTICDYPMNKVEEIMKLIKQAKEGEKLCQDDGQLSN